MTIKLTQEEFLRRAQSVHRDKYSFDKSVYTGGAAKVEVTCLAHGDFSIRADSLLNGHGCKACGLIASISKRKKNPIEVAFAIKKAHPRYTFQVPDGMGKTLDKIDVTCPEHGVFKASPHHLMRGRGCPKCGRERTESARRVGAGEFIARARAIHGDKYDYSNVEYRNNTNLVEIVCPEHGVFKQRAANHVNGSGCPACGRQRIAESRRVPFQDFVERARAVHGDNYEYSPAGYVTAGGLINIQCSRHGLFQQPGFDHLDGHGCPKCSTNKNSRPQEEIAAYLQDLGLDVVTNYKYDPDNHKKEIDIYVPEMRFGIEYHGLYYHSSRFRPRAYHFDKMKEAQAQGIRLVQLFSDEWESRPEVVRQFLANALGYGILTAHARQCRLVEVARQEADEFYDLHHIQGRCGHGLNYGLTHKGELVAVMTFSTRASSRSRASAGTQELVRFASSIRVVGGASRLLKKLVAETRARAVVSYSDNRLFTGGLYERLGFVRDGVSPPNYSYVDLAGARRLHKSKFQHKHLPKVLGANYDPSRSERDNCEAAGYYQLFDCGLTRWVLAL